jgi:hypothetical protein
MDGLCGASTVSLLLDEPQPTRPAEAIAATITQFFFIAAPRAKFEAATLSALNDGAMTN